VDSTSEIRDLHETCTRKARFCTSPVRVRVDDVVVEAEWEQSPILAPGGRRRRRPTLEDRLIARMLAPWLDGELARGVATSLSEAHAARASQLCGQRTRFAVARSLKRLIDRAEHPRRAPFNPAVPPCPEVRAAMPLILSIHTRLQSEESLDAQAIARLKTLLSDRNGPCYKATEPGALAAELEGILDAL